MDRPGVVSSESVGGQGIWSDVEILQHEEARLAKHAGKVVYQEPTPAEVEKHLSEPQHPTVKDATAAMQKHAISLYQKGLADHGRTNGRKVLKVESIFPTRDQIEEFEVARTEMQRAVAPAKLQTHQNMFYSPSEQHLRVILEKSFSAAIEANAVAFSEDPEQAMQEGFSRSGRLLVCRVVQSADVRVLNGKLIVKDTRGVQPTFLLTLSTGVAPVNARPAANNE